MKILNRKKVIFSKKIKQNQNFSKKGAMEMSVGTIVTIVLLMTVMVLGIFLVKKIMCTGIVVVDDIDKTVENELRDLFGSQDYGVKCMGEAGQKEAKISDDGRRKIFCVFNVKDQAKYNLKVTDIESLRGASTSQVKSWILDKDFRGDISAGKDTQIILDLDIPGEITETNLKITVEEENLDTGTTKDHILRIDVVHVGGITSAVC